MQSSLKKSLYLGLAALSFAGVAAVSTTASAKSYATAGAYTTLKTDAATRNVEATGTNALYTKPGTVKGAKVVASKATMAKLASSKKSADYFRAYGVKTTNRGSVYYKVVTMDGKYRGYVYGGTSDTAFAGGIKSASTTTAATAPSKTQKYYIAKPGTANTLWSAPKYTQYKATKVINSTSAVSSHYFYVDQAATKTREGSLYYHVVDQNNTKISGWIYAKALQTTPNAETNAETSVTLNYVDQATGKTVKSGVLVTETGAVAGQAVGTSSTALNAQAVTATPDGYTLTNTTPISATTKYGDSLTVTVTANAAAGITISGAQAANKDTGATDDLTTTDALASDVSTKYAAASAAFTKDFQGASGSAATSADVNTALTTAKLNTIYIPTGNSNTDGNKLYTKYTLNTSALPSSVKYGNSLTLNYTEGGVYALTSGTGTMTPQD